MSVPEKEAYQISKGILLPESFIKDVYRLILALCDYELGGDVSAIINRLELTLNDKIMIMQKRQAYTAYKTAPGFSEKEAARQKYLGLAGMHKDWRWGGEAEQSNCER